MLLVSLNTPAQSLIILANSRHAALAIEVLVKGPRMTSLVVPYLLGPWRVRGVGWRIMSWDLHWTSRSARYTLHTSYDFGLDLELVKCGDISADLLHFSCLSGINSCFSICNTF